MYNIICPMIIYSVKNKKNRTTFSIGIRHSGVRITSFRQFTLIVPNNFVVNTDIFSLAAKGIFRILSSFYDNVFCENSLMSKVFDRVLNTPLSCDFNFLTLYLSCVDQHCMRCSTFLSKQRPLSSHPSP